ncbi:hypothetical protein VTO42DRAFT_4965 [Malbranchea cinnamomea]
MELTFAIDDALASGQRKRSPRACLQCKMKKKRCTHTAAWQEMIPRQRRQNGATRTRALTTGHQHTGSMASATAEPDSRPGSCAGASLVESSSDPSRTSQSPGRSLSSDDSPPGSQRFVGDLNPETVFYSENPASSDICPAERNDIGVWVSRSRGTGQERDIETDAHPMQRLNHDALRGKDQEGSSMPEVNEQLKLIHLYFNKIHPFLPIVVSDEKSLRQTVLDKTASPILIKAVCLVASKAPRAGTHFRFEDDLHNLVPVSDFRRRIYADLSSRPIEEEKNKVTAIQCLALMSLHAEGSDGGERSSLSLMRAIHLAQTIGLHLGNGQRTKQNESSLSLFWALWSLDRVNAAINGRPVMMHDCDIGLKIVDSCRLFSPSFRIWLLVAQLLDRVIELYRPGATVSADSSDHNEFPGFEDLVEQSDGWSIEQGTLVSLEIFYHAVSILSCRLRTAKEHPSSSVSHIRQNNSSRQIVAIMQLQSHTSFAPLPVIPYAVSLSLAVAYKQLRQSKLETTRELARRQLILCSEALEKLSYTWWSAGTMAKLARKALLQLEKATQTKPTHMNPGSMASHTDDVPLCKTRESTSGMEDMDLHRSHPNGGQHVSFPVPGVESHPNSNNLPQTEESNLEQSSLPRLSPIPDLRTGGIDINIAEIDTFLGDFLDLRPWEQMTEDSQLINFMRDIG